MTETKVENLDEKLHGLLGHCLQTGRKPMANNETLTAIDKLPVARLISFGYEQGATGLITDDLKALATELRETKAKLAEVEVQRDMLLEDDLANAISAQAKTDANDIRDQFGERLWKTPDELVVESEKGGK